MHQLRNRKQIKIEDLPEDLIEDLSMETYLRGKFTASGRGKLKFAQ